MKRIFVTGISTDVGKTVVSAILVEALQADYWKPIQAGDLHHTDTDKVKRLISNQKTAFHDSAYELTSPMSPHAAAEIDGLTIDASKINSPKTDNILVVEGAGGLLVPLNDETTIFDLINENDFVIVVSRNYLGSINHTLLTLEMLKRTKCKTYLIFSGKENHSTESIIEKMSEINVLGRIEEEPYFDRNVILEYASKFQDKLKEIGF